MTKKMRVTTEMEQEALQYLNELRDSGYTNMWGASPYVAEHFGVSRQESRDYLTLWMANFQPDGEYIEVIQEES